MRTSSTQGNAERLCQGIHAFLTQATVMGCQARQLAEKLEEEASREMLHTSTLYLEEWKDWAQHFCLGQCPLRTQPMRT
ncbi:MAG: hypothetical protein IMW91_06075 [Firmicutes bacterium]|nr:hypothetical protein [Bacillota bacterium]